MGLKNKDRKSNAMNEVRKKLLSSNLTAFQITHVVVLQSLKDRSNKYFQLNYFPGKFKEHCI